MQFDTFGFTAAELARKQAEKEQNERYDQSFITIICLDNGQFVKSILVRLIANFHCCKSL